jgi:hypothetical protein
VKSSVGGCQTIVSGPRSAFPRAGIPANAQLPCGASPKTYISVIGAISGFQFTNYTQAFNGDTTDATNIDKRITVLPADCPILSMDSTSLLSNDGVSGTIFVDADASFGTALLLRGYEPTNNVPITNLDMLPTNSVLKFDILLQGPFNLNTSNCTAIIIQFTTQTGSSNLWFVMDGEAKSNPMNIVCPQNVVTIPCSAGSYPALQVTGACGGVTVSNYPPIGQLIGGVINTVIATATDGAGDTTNCTYFVYRTADAFNGFFSPIGGVGGTCSNAFVSINQTRNLPVKFQDFCNGAALGGGQPTMTLALVTDTNTCALSTILYTNFTFTSNVWHANLDTTTVPKGTYKLTATLQDNSQQFVYIKLN